MDTEVLTFADRLREIAAAHGWSLEILANMTGYKSRTSVSRVLQERSSHKNRLNFFKSLCDCGALSREEESRLRKALDVSLIGKDKANARQIFRALILGDEENAPDPPNFARLLDMLRVAKGARLLVVNCLHEHFFACLRDLLYEKKGHSARHYCALEAGESEAANVMYCLSRMTYLPNYAAFVCERDARGGNTLPGLDMLCATMEESDGNRTDVLALFSDASNVAVHRIPAEYGLFSFIERALLQAMTCAEPATQLCSSQEGPESFVNTMSYWAECERNRDMYHVKSDLCVNNIPTQYLRSCLNERELLRFFPTLDLETLRAMKEKLLYFQLQRYKNMYESKNPKHLILTMDGLRDFAATGMTSEHFVAMRPFTVRERIAILEDLQTRVSESQFFFLYFFKESFRPRFEINCWDGYGMTAFPILKEERADNYCNNVIFHSRMVSAFREYFMEDLRKNQTISTAERNAFLRALIDMLKAQIDD